MSNQYVPGICNIGPAEIARRRRVGWIGLIVAVALLFLLILLNAPSATHLLVFFPAAISSSGFLQAHLKFCAGFGSKGLYNFSSKVGKTNHVDDAKYRLKDQRRALQIILMSTSIGLIVAFACFFI